MEKRELQTHDLPVEEENKRAENEFFSGSLDDLEREAKASRAYCRRFVLMMDATSSMQSHWAKATKALTLIAESIFDRSSVPVELQVVAYRDFCDGPNIVEKSFFSNDRTYLKQFISEIRSIGGGDAPEAISVGLDQVLKDSGQVSRVILLGDAPDHHEQLRDAINQATELGRKAIPVYALYLNDYAKESFERIAKVSGGRAFRLEDYNETGMADIITTLLAQDKVLGITYVPKTIEARKIQESL